MNEKKFILSTKSMTYMAIFAALQLVLEWLTQLTPQMPQGGNVSFSLVALFLCSYLMGWRYGAVVSLVCTFLHFVLGFAQYYGVLSLLFDYLIPLFVIGIAALLPLLKIQGKAIPISIIITMLIKLVCHLISGWYAFATPLEANLTYNIPYNLASLVTCFILFMILYPRLQKVIKL